MTFDLFSDALEDAALPRGKEAIGPGAFVLRGFALPCVDELLSGLHEVEQRAAFRHLVTPGGFTMSVAMTNCGRLGWISDRRGYRYGEHDPETGLPWPAMPAAFARLAQ
ncbi:MAG TPA: alpha-ketoglutarate-dependent dioxygenase AlkB, partial [Variovorax sp.]|nr:alpha-ketoglutarate-dependent dioxygenase AlkB [Variovorax sp.]